MSSVVLRPAVVAVAIMALFAAGVQAASVVVVPARLEVEVTPEGAEAALNFLNRGDEPVAFALFVGMGSHNADGMPLFYDHVEAKAEGESLVKLNQDFVTLHPGELKTVVLEFPDAPGKVAAYPVIFAEFRSLDEEAADASAMRSVARLAVPVLLTYRATRDERRLAFEIEDLQVRPAPQRGELVVDVTVRNVGNVHDWVRGRVHWVGSDGMVRGESLLPETRVLPGAARTLTATMAVGEGDWSSGLAVRAVSDSPGLSSYHVVAMIYGDGWSSAPAVHPIPAAIQVALAPPDAGSGEEPVP